MAIFIPVHQACAQTAPVSLLGWLMQRLRLRARRLGNADELPDHMRRDMGLGPTPPGPHYRDFL